MSDSSGQHKASSVAAFLFLPQFGRMLKGASHIAPIFIRTIAGILVQADLLPPTHPATLYGDPGVEKCKFTQMLGDAWYTLRADHATPYQWSVFCSVGLIIFFVISSVIMTVVNLASVYIGSAAAQIFTNNAGASDFASLKADTTTGGLWDNAFPVASNATNGAHGTDYAIIFLDKMLRLGAMNGGTPIQNAVGAMMEVYNTGIMVIAGVMIFWLIVSVVIDAARTGQIGGGRHNLVWAPMRIIFALGLMVPLGANGFSTGQFMVMKVAEWGSNLGTNTWDAYLTSLNNNMLYKLPSQKNLMGLTNQMLRAWVCVVAANGYSDQAEGANLPNEQIVARYDNTGINTATAGYKSYSYRKQTGSNECGTVTFPDPTDPLLTQQLAAASAPNPITGGPNDALEAAKIQFEITMATDWKTLFYAGPSNPPAAGGLDSPDGSSQTQIEQIANAFACAFVSQHIWGTDQNNQDVLHLNCSDGGTVGNPETAGGINCNGPGGKPASGIYPDMSCVEDGNPNSNKALEDYMQGEILRDVTAAYTTYDNAVTKAIGKGHGWADMGSFFENLASMNRFVLSQSKIPVTITAGSVPEEGGLSEKINEVLNKYDEWWQKVPLSASASITTAGSTQGGSAFTRNVNTGGNNPGVSTSNGGSGSGGVANFISHMPLVGAVFGGIEAIGKLVNFFVNAAKSVAQFAKSPSAMIAQYIGNSIHSNLLDLVQPDIQDKTAYPLTILVGLGHELIAFGLALHLAILGFLVIAGAIPLTSLGSAIGSSSLMTLLGSIATMFLSCGAILSFWLPLLPLIRVAYAVLTWAAVVFEAVALVPIAALSFLSTTGEGWDAKHVFMNWLDVFTRPVLTVVGFVGSLLLFNTFFDYLYTVFKGAMHTQITSQTGITGLLFGLIALLADTVVFFMVIYTSANTCFKLISSIPDAFYRWAPIGGSRSGSEMGDGGDFSGGVGKMGSMSGEAMAGAGQAGNKLASTRREARESADREAKADAKSAASESRTQARHDEIIGALKGPGDDNLPPGGSRY